MSSLEFLSSVLQDFIHLVSDPSPDPGLPSTASRLAIPDAIQNATSALTLSFRRPAINPQQTRRTITDHLPGHRLTTPSILHQLLSFSISSDHMGGPFILDDLVLRPHPSLPPSASDQPCKTCQYRVSGPDETVMGTLSTTSIETRANWRLWMFTGSQTRTVSAGHGPPDLSALFHHRSVAKVDGDLRLGPLRCKDMVFPISRACFIIDPLLNHSTPL